MQEGISPTLQPVGMVILMVKGWEKKYFDCGDRKTTLTSFPSSERMWSRVLNSVWTKVAKRNTLRSSGLLHCNKPLCLIFFFLAYSSQYNCEKFHKETMPSLVLLAVTDGLYKYQSHTKYMYRASSWKSNHSHGEHSKVMEAAAAACLEVSARSVV